jgi:hypothetical protein
MNAKELLNTEPDTKRIPILQVPLPAAQVLRYLDGILGRGNVSAGALDLYQYHVEITSSTPLAFKAAIAKLLEERGIIHKLAII